MGMAVAQWITGMSAIQVVMALIFHQDEIEERKWP